MVFLPSPSPVVFYFWKGLPPFLKLRLNAWTLLPSDWHDPIFCPVFMNRFVNLRWCVGFDKYFSRNQEYLTVIFTVARLVWFGFCWMRNYMFHLFVCVGFMMIWNFFHIYNDNKFRLQKVWLENWVNVQYIVEWLFKLFNKNCLWQIFILACSY